MTTTVDIVNRALQAIGTRTTVTALTEVSNEAVQANLVINATRDELIRKAPWNCATNFNYATYITSVPGTPENPGPGTLAWQKGLPAPPWAYEYQYPSDCLRPLWVVPQFFTGFASGGVPITTALTGGASSLWAGPPIRFKVAIDQFLVPNVVIVINGGNGYNIDDLITLNGTSASYVGPIGAQATLKVTGVLAGAVTSAVVFSPGSYFAIPDSPIPQGSTTGAGTGATFNLVDTDFADQRVVLTNQEQAILAYLRRVTDPNVMDEDFVEAWVSILGARLAFALTGDKAQANMQIQLTNNKIIDARQTDANEGLTINDVTPDWIRARGIYYPEAGYGPNASFDWGPLFTMY